MSNYSDSEERIRAARIITIVAIFVAALAVFQLAITAEANDTPQGPTVQVGPTDTPNLCLVKARVYNRLLDRLPVYGGPKITHRKRPVRCATFNKRKRQVAKYRRNCSGGSPAQNRCLGRRMAAARGWTGSQWQCLDTLWGVRESGWLTRNTNPSSGADGIPQALPPSKMGAGWQTNPKQQIRWGLNYIRGRYGTPCAALAHSHSSNWY